MAQKKGQTGNPNGRPKGVPNKATGELRATIQAIVEGAMPDFVSVLGEMRETNPVKYAENVRALMEYITPKMRAVDNTHEISDETLQAVKVIFGPKKD